MPESVDNCVESVVEEDDVTESEAYAICWSRYNDGELKEDDDYQWGPYHGQDEEPEYDEDEEKDVEDEEKDVEEKECPSSCGFCELCVDHPEDKKSSIAREVFNEYNVDRDVAKVVAHLVMAADKGGVQDKRAVKSVGLRRITGEWKSVHPSEKSKSGRHHLRETYKYLVDKIIGQGEVAKTLSKSETMEKIDFTAEFSGSQTVFKADDEFVIWGPASVEVVDKEGDRIHAEALEDALPQLLKRGRLSLEHSDQLVGEIIESFELEEPVELEIDGQTFKRDDFPTDVLELDGMDPALFVCGKIYDDTRQSRRVRESIEEGELNSYSISGEALVSRSKIENGEPVNDIVEMDLSAVTVCEEGMNQHANFATVKKGDDEETISPDVLKVKSDDGQVAVIKGDDSGNSDEHPGDRNVVITKSSGTSMSNEENTDEEPQELTLSDLKGEFESVVKDALSEEDFAQEDDILGKDDVENIVEDMIEQKMEEESSESDDVEKEDDDESSLTEDDVRSIVKEVLGDESDEEEVEKEDDEGELTRSDLEEVVREVVKEEDDDDDEKADDDDEEEKAGDDEDEEEEKDVEEGKQVDEGELAEMLADMTGASEDEAADMIDSLKMAEEGEQDADDEEKGEDDEEEEKGEDEEDEEEKGEDEEENYEDKGEDEDEDEEKGDGSSQYTVSELQEKLPEDVFDAVRGYIGEEKGDYDEDDETEKSDDPLGDLNIDKAVEQAVEQQFDTTDSPGAPSGSDVEKSYDEEGEEGDDDNPALSLWR